MSDQTQKTPDVAAAIKELRRYLLAKGHRFERGTRYEGQAKALSSVAQAIQMYEGMGYQKFMQVGDPPFYAMLARSRQEVHVFQPQDPQVREWLEDEKVALNDPTVRAYQLQSAGLSEGEVPVASKPQRFRITDVDGVFIMTSEEA